MKSERSKVMSWTVIHQKRAETRSGEFEGIFLGVDGSRWIAGRMYTGASLSDGFDRTGEWWYSHYFGVSDDVGFARTVREAVAGYLEMARAALLWDVVLEQNATDAVDRYLAELIPLDGVADMAAGWRRTDGGTSVNALGGTTSLLPAVVAKRQLLGFLRRTEPESESAPSPDGQGPGLDEAYERAIGAGGPLVFEAGRNTYWLTHDGHYSARHRFPRNPHPDRRGNDS